MLAARGLSCVLWSVVAVGCGKTDRVGPVADADTDADAPLVGTPGFAVGAIPALAMTCGAAPTTTSVPITNTGDAALVISSASVTGGFVVVTPLPLTVAAGAQATVTVRAPAAIIDTDRGGQVKTGKLTVTTNEAMPTHTINLSATVQGANLVFTDANATPIDSITLSDLSGACPAPVTVRLRNTGNRPITVGEGTASGFAVSGFVTGEIQPGSSAEQAIRVKTMGNCAADVQIAYPVSGTVCTMPTVKLGATFLIDPPESPCICP